MCSKWVCILLRVIVILGWLALSGCGGESWTYQADRELKPGPGLFSGEDGQFTLIGSSEKQEVQEKQTQKTTQ